MKYMQIFQNQLSKKEKNSLARIEGQQKRHVSHVFFPLWNQLINYEREREREREREDVYIEFMIDITIEQEEEVKNK